MSDSREYRAGFVAIAGRPNVGKSTLLNRLVGTKLAIITPKPQTTRYSIRGILTRDDAQIVLIDTPGIIEPRDRLNECLVEEARSAFAEVDLIYHLIEHGEVTDGDRLVNRLVQERGRPAFLLVNKIDLCKQKLESSKVEGKIPLSAYEEILPISALTGEGIDELLEKTLAYLPAGKQLYDEEELSDRPLRFYVAELVRERAIELTGEEIPYAVATEVDEFTEREEGKYFIRVIIFVEKDSQKGILIGRDGALIKRIGMRARKEIELLVQHPVYLELWVKVAHKWRKRPGWLRRFGFQTPKQ